MARSIRKSLGELDDGYLIKTERGERIFAEGDRVYFLRNDRDLGVKNGTLGTIVEIDDQSLKVAFKDGSDKLHHETFSLDRYNELDYGYAATIHKAQGVTVDRSFMLPSPYMDRHATYVGMTRHRENVELFWSKEEFSTYDAMVSTLSRERSKDCSLDYVTREFAYSRGIDPEELLRLENYHAEASPNHDAILDMAELRRDVETHNPELLQELTQRMTDDPEVELDLQNKPEKDVPDWYADLFYGFDKKLEAKEDFNDLFYGLDVDLSTLSDKNAPEKEVGDDQEIEF
jgi:hypothetical protein